MPTVAGLIPFTTIDYPDHLAAVVFFKGCPLRCPFCHNPNLQSFDASGDMSFEEIVDFLKNRRSRLDGVVLSGGEPLAQHDIAEIVKTIKAMGFKVGLHTSGTFPTVLRQILPDISWVGLDIKAPWHKYETLSGRPHTEQKVQESLAVLIQFGVSFEARTTCDPRFLSIADIYDIAHILKEAGCSAYALQKYRTFDGDKNPPDMVAIDAFFKDDALLTALKQTFPVFECR